MTEFDYLKKFLKENKKNIIDLYESEAQTISTSPELKYLENNFLFPFWEERKNKGLYFIINLPEDFLKDLEFEEIRTALKTDLAEALKQNNVVYVNNRFQVTNTKSEKITNDLIEQSSKNEDLIVILFSPDGIDFGIRGKIVKNLNVFYNEQDRAKHKELYDIGRLQECLKEYERVISQPGNNEAFFESPRTLKNLPDRPVNLLRNSPEKIMRDNLLAFLNLHTRHTFTKEIELGTERELDLYTEAEGKQYLIEVKWMGKSINSDRNGVSTTNYTDGNMRNGVIQTLEYIQEVIDAMNFSLQCGYLCIFDARDEKETIDYQDFKFVEERPELVPFFQQHFKKLDDINLNIT